MKRCYLVCIVTVTILSASGVAASDKRMQRPRIEERRQEEVRRHQERSIARYRQEIARERARQPKERPTYVVGETMSRVREEAERLNARTYGGVPQSFRQQLRERQRSLEAELLRRGETKAKAAAASKKFLEAKYQEHNLKWLNNKMNKNNRIVDHGIDVERRKRSPYYKAEKEAIAKRDYDVQRSQNSVPRK